MKRTNRRYKSPPNSKEPGAVKEKITLESALREVGVDEVFLARRLMDLLQAQRRGRNHKKGSWEKFEDYGTQLAALRETNRIFGVYPKDDLNEEDKVVTIHLGPLSPKGRRELADGEPSMEAAAGDGREHRERWVTGH